MEPLEEWLESMQPRIAGLLDLELPQGREWDYSPDSLARLEAEVLARAVPTPDFRQRVSGYLGEALLTTAGGRWGWETSRGLPLVLPDPELDLPPICPADLVERALANRDGDEFGRAYRALELAVTRRRATDPGWRPRKEPTPGLDPEPAAEPPAELDAWLAERKAGFAAWLTEYAPRPERWDFSVASLDELEEVLLRLVPAPEELAARAEFAEGASWYLGEVFRPVLSARWRYHPGEPDPENMFVGRPFLEQPVPNGRTVVPFVLLKGVLARREPGLLRGLAERLA
ncbi:hypothetical protein AB0J86_30265 [Micromonospora sp. NPDC049559]|uniref:hypothetical protein n=1 Tax=Micromonospora sp. NPDC049559 TaxID=3155923 RepID=UPI003433E1A2